MDAMELFNNQKNSTAKVDNRSHGIALSMVDVDSITLVDVRISEAYENGKKTGKPDIDELGNPKVSLKLHFVLKSGIETDITTASDYMNINLAKQLIDNKEKPVEVEDLYIRPFLKINNGGTDKNGLFGTQLFELRFKSIKLKSFESAK